MKATIDKTYSWRIVRPPLHPRFDMPSRKDLLDVFEGDDVKLIFEDDEGFGERMWVKVTRCGNSDNWEGTLDNDPIGEYSKPRLKYNSKIKFHPYNVIDIDMVRLNKDSKLEVGSERIPSDNVENDIKKKWYRDPQYLVPIAIAILGATTTIIVALL